MMDGAPEPASAAPEDKADTAASTASGPVSGAPSDPSMSMVTLTLTLALGEEPPRRVWTNGMVTDRPTDPPGFRNLVMLPICDRPGPSAGYKDRNHRNCELCCTVVITGTAAAEKSGWGGDLPAGNAEPEPSLRSVGSVRSLREDPAGRQNDEIKARFPIKIKRGPKLRSTVLYQTTNTTTRQKKPPPKNEIKVPLLPKKGSAA